MGATNSRGGATGAFRVMKQYAVCRSAKGIMTSHARAVVHMRGQHSKPNRLGLLLGAGVSRGLHLPDWGTLIERIATDADVGCGHLLRNEGEGNSAGSPQSSSPNSSFASITQILCSVYTKNQIAQRGLSAPIRLIDERKINTDWMKLIHKYLYQGITERGYERLIDRHPYLEEIVKIAKKNRYVDKFQF